MKKKLLAAITISAVLAMTFTACTPPTPAAAGPSATTAVTSNLEQQLAEPAATSAAKSDAPSAMQLDVAKPAPTTSTYPTPEPPNPTNQEPTDDEIRENSEKARAADAFERSDLPGSRSNPHDISKMPSNFAESEYSVPTYFRVTGQIGNKPGDIAIKTETTEYNVSISYPVIPEDLRQGTENCLLIYMESKASANKNGAILVLYDDYADVLYTDIPGHMDVSKCEYAMLAYDDLLILDNYIGNLGHPPTFDEEGRYSEIAAKDGSEVFDTYGTTDGAVVLDDYTPTSFTPSQKHIDIALDWLQRPKG